MGAPLSNNAQRRAFAAGVAAADADDERRRVAVKLRRLIERAEHALQYLDDGWEQEGFAILRDAIKEAKHV